MSLFLVAARLVRHVGRIRVATLVALAVAIVVIGAVLFSIFEHIGFGTSLYWSITTATTVGYGDVLPHNTAGRVIAAGVMLTTIPIVGAVFALLAGASVLARIRRLFGMDTSLPKQPYIVVYGAHPVIPRALAELARGGDPVVLVAPTRPPGTGDDTLVVAVAIHSLAPNLEVYALTQSPRVASALHELGVTYTLSSDELVGHTLAKSLETPQAGDLLLQLVDTSNYRLLETPIDDALVSQPLSKARGTAGRLVLGICRGATVDLGIGDDPVLAAGDRLIVLQPSAAD
jgi:voltage-gated potassium channel